MLNKFWNSRFSRKQFEGSRNWTQNLSVYSWLCEPLDLHCYISLISVFAVLLTQYSFTNELLFFPKKTQLSYNWSDFYQTIDQRVSFGWKTRKRKIKEDLKVNFLVWISLKSCFETFMSIFGTNFVWNHLKQLSNSLMSTTWATKALDTWINSSKQRWTQYCLFLIDKITKSECWSCTSEICSQIQNWRKRPVEPWSRG